jgi:glycosyltransferase involved in cell wall biosynthesis
MSLRVAHLSGLWQAGATAMVRIHNGLRDQGVQSRIHSATPVDDTLEHAFTLPRIKPTRFQKLSRKLRRNHDDWSFRIAEAAKSNPPFEAFSPPVALNLHDMSDVTRDVDVLHLHWLGSYFDFHDFFSQVEIPVVWTLHDQNPYLGGFHYQSDVDAAATMLPLEYECRDIKRESLSHLNMTVVGNSDWNAGQAMSTGVLPASTNVQRIYLPLPIEDYAALPKAECKAKLEIDANRFVVGFACAAMGNRRKGFIDLVSAIERLPASVQANTTLVSFGFQPTKEIRQRVSVPWVHMGRPSGGEEQSPIYSAMDLFVIPSLEEAFGQTALEALACQTPVVGTSVGGIPEMVIDAQTGLLAPPRCPQRLAECIERFFADPELRIQCGARGRTLAVERHSPQVIAAAYQDLYRQVHLNRSKDRPPLQRAA